MHKILSPVRNSLQRCTIMIGVAIAIFSPSVVISQDIFISRDTTINNTWKVPAGAILKFGSKGHISGKGTINGGIIDAPLSQWIFDTSLTIQPEGTYGKDFSAR